uniref:Multiple myeloma tumor-associated protein 2-like N-terminal domain-containing protein n=2 Tax=Lygus hesperus TaxID=30085 RepID=A0A0A9W3F1_LYGHE
MLSALRRVAHTHARTQMTFYGDKKDTPRGGCRGGAAYFSWENVKNDKDRGNYLGASLHARIGRSKDDDFFWYTKTPSNRTLQSQQLETQRMLHRQQYQQELEKFLNPDTTANSHTPTADAVTDSNAGGSGAKNQPLPPLAPTIKTHSGAGDARLSSIPQRNSGSCPTANRHTYPQRPARTYPHRVGTADEYQAPTNPKRSSHRYVGSNRCTRRPCAESTGSRPSQRQGRDYTHSSHTRPPSPSSQEGFLTARQQLGGFKK